MPPDLITKSQGGKLNIIIDKKIIIESNLNKITIVFILILFPIRELAAQNLVLNGDFEQVNVCSEYMEKCSPVGWRSTNQKLFGFTQGRKNNYIQLLLFIKGKNNQRKFAQTELLCPLEKDEVYEISMRIKANVFGIESMCVGFSDSFEFDKTLDFNPIYSSKKCTHIIESVRKDKWVEIKFEYKAIGFEKFICIGNLYQDSATNYVVLDKKAFRKLKKSYQPQGFIEYGIDDVVLKNINGKTCQDFEDRKRSVFSNRHRHTSQWEMYETKNIDSIVEIKSNGIIVNEKKEAIILKSNLVLTRELVLDDLNFENNEYQLTTENIIELDPIIQEMLENNLIRIRITGHTDSLGSKKNNQILSLKRAESVRNYLIRKGIHKKRMDIEGKGESELLELNEEGDKGGINRRVVIEIL